MMNWIEEATRPIGFAGVIVMSTLLLVDVSAAENPIRIGSRLELFVDRHLVAKTENVDFRLHHPQKLPLPKSPLVGGYATVIKDGDLLRGYYREMDPSYTGRTYSGHPEVRVTWEMSPATRNAHDADSSPARLCRLRAGADVLPARRSQAAAYRT